MFWTRLSIWKWDTRVIKYFAQFSYSFRGCLNFVISQYYSLFQSHIEPLKRTTHNRNRINSKITSIFQSAANEILPNVLFRSKSAYRQPKDKDKEATIAEKPATGCMLVKPLGRTPLLCPQYFFGAIPWASFSKFCYIRFALLDRHVCIRCSSLLLWGDCHGVLPVPSAQVG
jgi:hypothetical protein